MNPRSAHILAYKDKTNVKCRVCLGIRGNNIVVEYERQRACTCISNNVRFDSSYTCCVYGNPTINTSRTTGFHFDNTQHKIILSSQVCRICMNSNCDNNPKNCLKATYFINEYLKNIKRIGIKNIPEL